MAVALDSRAAVDVAKANLADVYGNAARLVRERDAALKASYDQISKQIQQNAAGRVKSDAAAVAAQEQGKAAGAQSLGLTAPPRSANNVALGRVTQDEYTGNAKGWDKYLDTTRDIASDRNKAGASAFDYMGGEAQKSLEEEFLAFLSSGGGGYGGGGGGGGGYGDEEGLIEYPGRVNQMEPGVARGLAATRLRLEKQGGLHGGKAMPRDYTYSVSKNSNKKLRKKEGKKNRDALAQWR